MVGRSASGPLRLDEGQILDLQRDQLHELDDAIGNDVHGGGFTRGGRGFHGGDDSRRHRFLDHGFGDEGGVHRLRDGSGGLAALLLGRQGGHGGGLLGHGGDGDGFRGGKGRLDRADFGSALDDGLGKRDVGG